MSPLHFWMLLDLLYTITHKLFMFARTPDPVQGYTAVEPTMQLSDCKSLHHFLHIRDEIACYMR